MTKFQGRLIIIILTIGTCFLGINTFKSNNTNNSQDNYNLNVIKNHVANIDNNVNTIKEDISFIRNGEVEYSDWEPYRGIYGIYTTLDNINTYMWNYLK